MDDSFELLYVVSASAFFGGNFAAVSGVVYRSLSLRSAVSVRLLFGVTAIGLLALADVIALLAAFILSFTEVPRPLGILDVMAGMSVAAPGAIALFLLYVTGNRAGAEPVADPRRIAKRMRRHFRGVADADGWEQLMVNDELDAQRVQRLIERHILGDELYLFVDPRHWVSSSKADAFGRIQELLEHGAVKIADPHFQGRVLIDPIGVGVGVSH